MVEDVSLSSWGNYFWSRHLADCPTTRQGSRATPTLLFFYICLILMPVLATDMLLRLARLLVFCHHGYRLI